MTIEQIRERALSISERAKSDPAFQARIHEDPTGVLRAEGIPDRAIPDLVREGTQVQVSGYMRPSDCNDLTCIISICPESCMVTVRS